MTRLLVGTDSRATSERLIEYLSGCLGPGDAVYLVTSHAGGERTTAEEIRVGDDALDVLEDGLDGVSVERDQFTRGNEPVEDLLAAADEWDADEFVIGFRKRSTVGKMVFGSTAQNLLLETDLPVRCVPLASE